MIVHMQTSVVYLISCTYLQIVGTNQSRRGNDVNLSATCHLMKVHGVCVWHLHEFFSKKKACVTGVSVWPWHSGGVATGNPIVNLLHQSPPLHVTKPYSYFGWALLDIAKWWQSLLSFVLWPLQYLLQYSSYKIFKCQRVFL